MIRFVAVNNENRQEGSQLPTWEEHARFVAPSQGLATPLWFILLLWLVPPITEEAIRLDPLLLPWARQRLHSGAGALWTGTALGVGFGLGEAMFIACGGIRQGTLGSTGTTGRPSPASRGRPRAASGRSSFVLLGVAAFEMVPT